MRQPTTVLRVSAAVLVVLVAIAAAAAPVSAHVNDLGVDPQVSADGTVVVETVFAGSDGFVVLHEVNGSEPGEPVGHVAVSEEGGLKEDVTVGVDEATWRDWSGDRQLWAVLHADDGDGEFEPSEDEMVEQFGDPAGERFTLERGDDPAYVTAREFAAQESDDGTVTVRAATLSGDGHVVLRADTGDGPGDVVGSSAVPAGTSRNVTVAIDDDYFRDAEDSFTLYAAVYTDDGDGAFGDADAQITAGEAPVATLFGVEKTGDALSTQSPTDSAGDEGDHEGDGHNDDDHEHDHSPTDGGAGGDDTGKTASDGAGLGLLASLVVAGLVGLGATAMRRR